MDHKHRQVGGSRAFPVGGTLALLAVFGALGGGCAEHLKGGGQDAPLVTEGTEKTSKKPAGTGALWPLATGKGWQMLTFRPNQKSVNSVIQVAGPCRLEDGRTGTLVRSTRAGKLFRVEVYDQKANGSLSLLALGETDKKLLTFTPAIPFLSLPVEEGSELPWKGIARIDGKDYSASATHRLSGTDTIRTPFESLLTYRLDGIISLRNGTQRIDYPAVMWFVPGKGVGQRRLADQGAVALEVITKF